MLGTGICGNIGIGLRLCPVLTALSGLLLAQVLSQANKLNDRYCFAQPLVPVLLINKSCPSGFFASEGYCIPLNIHAAGTPGVIPVYTREVPKSCPTDFYRNGDYCQTIRNSKKAAIPSLSGKCPLTYYQLGDYCFDTNARYTCYQLK